MSSKQFKLYEIDFFDGNNLVMGGGDPIQASCACKAVELWIEENGYLLLNTPECIAIQGLKLTWSYHDNRV